MRGRPEEELLAEDQSNTFFGQDDNEDIRWGINGSFVSVDRLERRLSQVERVKQQNRENASFHESSQDSEDENFQN
jgi:deferrochelatase/peroxidase EfeB